jgi:hypothetical protein
MAGFREHDEPCISIKAVYFLKQINFYQICKEKLHHDLVMLFVR